MSGKNWLPAVLAATMLSAGCAGGSMQASPPLGQQSQSTQQISQHLQKTTAPTEAIKRMDAVGGAQSPTWQYLEPLTISDSGTFSVGQSGGVCSPINPIFGNWYIALDSFTLPMNSVSLPACKAPTSPSWGSLKVFAASKNHKASAAPQGSYNNLYIVELSVTLTGVNVTPIAGPSVTSAGTSTFAPLVSSLNFGRDGLYSFFVASYSGPTMAQPEVNCEAGATTCSLGASPTAGNKLVVIVSDGSGALPNLIVSDSNGTPLKQETISPNCGHCVAVYDETVPSGITGTVTYANGESPFYPNVSEIYELANVTGGRFASANTGLIPTTLASTISGVSSNDLQLCSYIQTGVSTGNVTLAFSNGSSELYDYQSNYDVFARETATGNASSSCTANNINPAYQAGMAYADYQ